MINKIKAKRMFDKNDKGKCDMHSHLSDKFNTDVIVLEVHKPSPNPEHWSTIVCPESELFKLTATDDELELMGWDGYKSSLIADGTITQQDIDTHKVIPEVKTKLDKMKQDIKADPEILAKINTIRQAKGKGAY